MIKSFLVLFFKKERLPFFVVFALLSAQAATQTNWYPPDPQNTLVIDTSKGRIVVEMRPDLAPMAVARIKLLSREHVYDGLLFHRVVANYVDQTGNPNNHDGGVSSHPNLPPEFRAVLKPGQIDAVAARRSDGISGFIGATPVDAGVNPAGAGSIRVWADYCAGMAGMGREADPGSANSEIFFMREASRSLDHDYTPWGRVVVGLEVVRAIAIGEPPAHPDRMERVRQMADLPAAERPRFEVIDTRSSEFKADIDAVRRRKGADFTVCDVKVRVRTPAGGSGER
jgi:peptidylprolyl isomerase